MQQENQFNVDIVFVVLHYNSFKETIDCVDSIFNNIDTESFKIVIIDNKSPNSSGSLLLKKYQHDNVVDVICSDINLGFAKGNNLGIKFAIEQYRPKYICCLNNDTLLLEKKFFYKINLEYENSKAAVIAPKVFLKNGDVQTSPKYLYSLQTYKNELKLRENNKWKPSIKNKVKDILKQYVIKYPYLYWKRHRSRFLKKYSINREENIVLHGCCLVFTPLFFCYLDGFNPKTFLFREEELLFISLKKYNLKSVYLPEISILHLEDAATNSVYSNSKKKNEFINQNQIHSLRILIDELEKTNSRL